MRRSSRPLVIASRASALARAQAQMVASALAVMDPKLRIEFQWIESEGDQDTSRPLSGSGGKGLFTRAVEKALLAGSADLAVHSLKDLPAGNLTSGLVIAAIPQRADARDCLIAQRGESTIEQLPPNALVGSASPRRKAQLLRIRRDLRIELIRGNIETRLRKVLDERHFDGTLLAVAGLTRAGLGQHAIHPIDTTIMLPAACQGALALQCRGDDHVTLLRCLPMNDSVTAACVHAERGIVAGLHGSCDSPIAALCEPAPEGFRLRVRVLSLDGTQCLEEDQSATQKGMGKLVRKVIASLKKRGVDAVLSKTQRDILAGSR